MSFKKNNPGCPCICSDVPCDGRCLFKCAGEDCGSGVCLLVIEMPEPETVDSLDEVSEDCPPDEASCPNSAPCFACKEYFDKAFNVRLSSVGPEVIDQLTDCNDWSLTLSSSNFGGALSCWIPEKYACPYDSDFSLNDCFSSGYTLSPGNAIINDFSSGIIISGTWDGSCGTITVKIRYSVRQEECLIPVPIDGCEDPIITFYEHTFELDYCTCTELLNNFTYVGVTSQNSCRGITVPDPCNVASAIVSLRDYTSPESTLGCAGCLCYECNNYEREILLSVSGPSFTGTLTLQNNSYGCEFSVALPEEICSNKAYTITVYLTCLGCDAYRANLVISETLSGANWLYGVTANYTCAESPEFDLQEIIPGYCGFGNYTFQLL